MRILTVVGNRPQFIKAAAVSGPLRAEHEELLVHTGQHYDEKLSTIFFRELGLTRPDRELGIGGGSNTSQTARMLGALEPLLLETMPDAVLVYGDTNSTLAGALTGAQQRVPVIHIEAGMRSFDRSMPEELNRVLCDHMSTLLLCASETAAENLRKESVTGRSVVVGDVMVDVALKWQAWRPPQKRSPHQVRRGAGGLPAAHSPSRRQRRRSTTPARFATDRRGATQASRIPRAPAHTCTPRGGRSVGAATGRSAEYSSQSRSATWNSVRFCAAPARY